MALTVASTALGAVALHSYRLQRQTHLAEQLRAQAIAETYAAQIAPRLAAHRRTQAVAFIRELPWHADSRMVGVLDPAGETIAAVGAVQMLDVYAALQSTGPGPTWHVKPEPSGLNMEYTLAAVPIRTSLSDEPLGTLVYGMVTPASSSLMSPDNWGFFLYMGIIAATGIILGVLWLKRRVLDPLAVLTGPADTISTGHALDELPVDRDDEIGLLARTLHQVRTEADDWRTRANRLERTINARVAHETERITRELKNAQKKIWTDPLTQLGNRRLLDEKFEEIFQAQAESGQELSIVMMDIDNFKLLNDTLGHHSGDELLQFTGELLRQCLREQDLAVRYGGDEFMLILPSVSPDQARAIAERTIAMFAQQSRLLAVTPKPSMSAGIASLQQHQPASAEDLLKMADSALYRAKHSGKARVTLYTPTLEKVGA